MPRLKLQPRVRRESMLVAALQIAGEPGGWGKLTAAAIARQANCSYGLVCTYLGSIGSIRRIVVRTAVKQENFDILIQALIANDPEARRMRPLLKQKAFTHVAAAE